MAGSGGRRRGKKRVNDNDGSKNRRKRRKSDENNDSSIEDEVIDDEAEMSSDEEAEKSTGRLADIDPKAYTINSMTVGGRVKEAGEVIATRMSGGKDEKKLNVNCRVETFGLVMGNLRGVKRDWVAEMGMEQLCYLCGMALPRSLCYWLMTRVDVINQTLLSSNGIRIRLSPAQVRCVLGIPRGEKEVPRKPLNDEMKELCTCIWDQFKQKCGKNTFGITRKRLLQVVESDGVGEVDFKRCFLMLALTEVLCPTTSHRLPVSLLAAATVAAEAKEYDWCTLVLDHLLHAVENFGRRFYPFGYAKGCGGCTLFLAILYLDRLDRPPLRWGLYPRIKVWSLKALNKAKNDDMVESKDYGKIGCVDVAYGEKHPCEARDEAPVELEGPPDNWDVALNPNRKRRRGPTSSLIPRDYKERKKTRCEEARTRRRRKRVDHMDNMDVEPLNVGNYENEDAQNVNEDAQNVNEEAESLNMDGGEAGNVDGEAGNVDGEAENEDGEANIDQQPEIDVDQEPQNQDDEPDHVDIEKEPRMEDQPENQKDQPEIEKEGQIDIQKGLESMFLNSEETREGEGSGKCSPSYETLQEKNSELISQYFDGEIINGNFNESSRYPWFSSQDRPLGGDMFGIDLNLQGGDGSVRTDGSDMFGIDLNLHGGGAGGDGVGAGGDGVDVPRGDADSSSSDRSPSPPPVDAMEVERSRKQRKTKASSRLCSVYDKAWRGGGPYNKKLAEFALLGGNLLRNGNDIEMIRVSGMSATLGQCASVVRPKCLIDANYVRVAGLLYEKVWDEYYTGRSRRVMMDPDFGTLAASTEQLEGQLMNEIFDRCAARIRETPLEKLNLIFVPVLAEMKSWWCAIFSLTREEVVVFDSQEIHTAHEVHHEEVLKLKFALDQCLNRSHPSWDKFSPVMSFKPSRLDFQHSCELVHSGLEMLIAVKRSARRLTYDVHMESTAEKEGPMLLHEDVLSKHNEVREDVLNLLKTHM